MWGESFEGKCRCNVRGLILQARQIIDAEYRSSKMAAAIKSGHTGR
jgi:hypothetical protein